MPLLVTPSTPPRPFGPAVDWSGATSTWTGWDGTEWALSDPASGVLLVGDVRGMAMPKLERYVSVSPARAGSRRRGTRIAEREVFWTLGVYSGDGSQAWLDYDRAFWSTMHPDQPGVWSVTQPDGTTRRLACAFLDDGDASFDRNPSTLGWQVYGVTLIAEWPYWAGDPITRSWSDTASQPFFGGNSGGGFGPPFYISAGNTISSARMPNPGDVDAYPVWTISGPTTSVTVGVGDATITYAASIASGASITIDTHPDKRTVVDQSGVDRIGNLSSSVAFAPIPAGSSVDLSLAMTGTGSVSASIEPQFFRAW